jgi:hypothetical protein
VTSRQLLPPASGQTNTCNVPEAGPLVVGVKRSLRLQVPGLSKPEQVSKEKSKGGLIPSPLAAATW